MASITFADVRAAENSIKDNNWSYTENVSGLGAKPKVNADTQNDLNDFAKIAAFLCNSASFENSMNEVSRMLWKRYRSYDVNLKNKFTCAIGDLAAHYGFRFQNRTIDTSPSPVGIRLVGGDPQLGYMLRNKLFWKDSMDIRHGEHTHSLQWLAIAHGVRTGNLASQYRTVKSAPELYALTGHYRAKPKKMRDYTITMWQWLADCFPNGFDKFYGDPLQNGETLHSHTYRSPQVITDFLLKSNGAKPIDKHFVSTYLHWRYANRKWLNISETYTKEGKQVSVKYDGVPDKRATGSWEQSKNAAVADVRQLRQKGAPTHRSLSTKPAVRVEGTFHGEAGTLVFFKAS